MTMAPKHDAGQRRALAEHVQPVVDQPGVAQGLLAHLGGGGAGRGQGVVDQPGSPGGEVGDDRRDHGRGVQPRRRLERLRPDQQPDVEQDRHDGRQREHRGEQAEQPEEAQQRRRTARWPSSSRPGRRPPSSPDVRCRPPAGTASRGPSRRSRRCRRRAARCAGCSCRRRPRRSPRCSSPRGSCRRRAGWRWPAAAPCRPGRRSAARRSDVGTAMAMSLGRRRPRPGTDM